MLSGLMSRWMMPSAWAAPSASATSRAISSVSSMGAAARAPAGPQRFAGDVGHHVEEQAVGRAAVEQRQDVRVLQPGGGLDLGQEPLRAQRRRQLGVEHLDGHLAVVPEIVRQVDRGHAAGAELALDAVAVGERGGEALHGPDHCRIRFSSSVNQFST
jgi:hypothetical protein